MGRRKVHGAQNVIGDGPLDALGRALRGAHRDRAARWAPLSALALVIPLLSACSPAPSVLDPRQESIALERWRPAVESYAPSVQAENTTTLDGARAPFAGYISAMHRRIHPFFADFLSALGYLPQGHPINQNLGTHIEIVLAKETGKLVRMGVTKRSGVTAFDVGALEAVDRAGPFGEAPDGVASPDGNVYLHWEFYRDPHIACNTRNTRPYKLKRAP